MHCYDVHCHEYMKLFVQWKWNGCWNSSHYNDVIMCTIASQISSLIIVYSIVYSDADQRKHQSSASLPFVRGIHRGPVNSSHKWPVTQKMFPFDDAIMFREKHKNSKFNQHHSCWWPGDESHQSISRQDADLVFFSNIPYTTREGQQQFHHLSIPPTSPEAVPVRSHRFLWHHKRLVPSTIRTTSQITCSVIHYSLFHGATERLMLNTAIQLICSSKNSNGNSFHPCMI